MSNALIRSAFEAKLKPWAVAQNIRIAFENVTFEDTQTGTFLACKLIPNTTGMEDLQQLHRRYQGFYQVSIYFQQGVGAGDAEAIAYALDVLFPASDRLISGGLSITITQPMSAAPAIETTTAFVIPVSCAYRTDTI